MPRLDPKRRTGGFQFYSVMPRLDRGIQFYSVMPRLDRGIQSEGMVPVSLDPAVEPRGDGVGPSYAG